MGGKNHSPGCICNFCIPERKTPFSEREMSDHLKKTIEGTKCRRCGRIVHFRKDDRGGGFWILDKLFPPEKHRCGKRDEGTLELFGEQI